MSSLYSPPATVTSRSGSHSCTYSQPMHYCKTDAASAEDEPSPVTQESSRSTIHPTPSHQRQIDNGQAPSLQTSRCSNPYERLQDLYNRLGEKSASGRWLPKDLKPATLHFGGTNKLTETINPTSKSKLDRQVAVEFGPWVPALYQGSSGLIAFEETVFDGKEPSLVIERMREQKRESYQTVMEVSTPGGVVPTSFVVGKVTQDYQSLNDLRVHNNMSLVSSFSRQVEGDFGLISPPYEKAETQDENGGNML